jgi:hypothetical protein
MKTTFGYFNENFELIKQFEVDLNTVSSSSDPLAFVLGVSNGQYNAAYKSKKNRNHVVNHGVKYSELAPEYLRGFLFGYRGILVPEGTKIRKGQEQNLALSHLNTYKDATTN